VASGAQNDEGYRTRLVVSSEGGATTSLTLQALYAPMIKIFNAGALVDFFPSDQCAQHAVPKGYSKPNYSRLENFKVERLRSW
jgi:hypothetical protein